jgi:hypothetical protein
MADQNRTTHESFEREEQVKGSSDRAFGLTFAVVFAVLAGIAAWRGGPSWPYTLSVSAIFALTALAVPGLLAPLNRVWLKFGLLLHKVTTPLILGLMFFLVVTPTALILRLFGKDLLQLNGDKDAASYWIERQPPGPSPESMPNQF